MNRRALITIFLIVFIDLLGFGLVLPLLPFVAETYQANAFQIGLLVATYSLFQFISSPILGHLSDLYGRKKLLIISQLGSVLGYILLGLAQSLPLLFISRVIDGITGGNISIAQAYIADVTSPKDRARGMGVIGAAFGLGFAIGPALGSLLYRWGGFSLPAFFAAAVGLFTALLTGTILKETVNVKARAVSPPSRLTWSALKTAALAHPLGLIIATFFLLSFAFSAMQGIFALWAEHTLGWGPGQVGFIFTYIGIGAIINKLIFLPRVVKRFGEKSVFIYSVMLLGLGLCLIPFSRHLSLLLLANTLLIIGNGLANSTSQSLASENVAPEAYGGTLGILQSGSSLGRILGPVVGGYIFSLFSPNLPFFLAGGMVICTFLILRAAYDHPPAFLTRSQAK